MNEIIHRKKTIEKKIINTFFSILTPKIALYLVLQRVCTCEIIAVQTCDNPVAKWILLTLADNVRGKSK